MDIDLGVAGRNWQRPPVASFDPASSSIREYIYTQALGGAGAQPMSRTHTHRGAWPLLVLGLCMEAGRALPLGPLAVRVVTDLPIDLSPPGHLDVHTWVGIAHRGPKTASPLPPPPGNSGIPAPAPCTHPCALRLAPLFPMHAPAPRTVHPPCGPPCQPDHRMPPPPPHPPTHPSHPLSPSCTTHSCPTPNPVPLLCPSLTCLSLPAA